jgi:hypothetical protein
LSRGRYIYISKDFVDFFPHLSKTVNNDAVVIPIVPFFSNTKVYSWLVFHNDKHNLVNGTRDEYRIYLNKGLDFDDETNKRIYQQNDIVVFERLFQDNNPLMPIYFMYRFAPESVHYDELETIFANNKARGGHAFFEGDISFIQSSLQSLEQASVEISDDAKKELERQQEEILVAADEEQVIETEDDIEMTRGAHLFNSVSFRDFVLLAYNYKCAITQQSIIWKNLNNLEAAHIQPKAQSGTFLPCNGIALCRDMHWAFDKGFITINKDFCVEVHPEVKNTLLQQYNGKKIVVPIDPFFQPASKFLEHHKLRIYGLFQYSGVIRS